MNPQQQAQPPGTNLIEAEIQHNIPVQPHSADEKNPILSPKQFVEHDNKNEEGLDEVLKDVNNSVIDSDKKPEKKSIFSFFTKAKANNPKEKAAEPNPPEQQQPPAQETKHVPARNSKKLIIPIVAALVAACLGMAAFYAFKKPINPASGKQASAQSNLNSAPSTTNKQITANDLKDFSDNIQSNFANLNDANDFSQTNLTDNSLGLQ
jgi:hypothetical protein